MKLSKMAGATIAALALGAALAGGGASGPALSTTSDLTIRHVARGCHAWAAPGEALARSRTIVLRAGRSLTVTNRDGCGAHRLVQTSGPQQMRFAANGDSSTGAVLEPLGPAVRIQLGAPGTYVFSATEDEDHGGLDLGDARGFGLGNLAATGDATLKLRVVVVPDRNHPPDL